MTLDTLAAELDQPYALSDEQITRFREDGFIRLPKVWSQDVLTYYGDEITRLTLEINPQKDVALEDRTTYGKAFIQVGNLWTRSEIAKAFSFNKRLARIAAELMGTRGTRMYHDQALYKEASGGFTPWHADQQYWPMATSKCVTAWCPFQAVPMEMGPMSFGRGSHLKNIGRDMEISDESEKLIRDEIKREGLLEVTEPFDLGDVSFHTGWTLHRAGPNTTGRVRCVHTVIYMDSEMHVGQPTNPRQESDRQSFSPGLEIGDLWDCALTPVLWERGE